MSDLLKSGVAWFNTVRVAHLSEPVVYYQVASQATFPMDATIGSTAYTHEQADGAVIVGRTTDFIVTIPAFEPQRGDVIYRGTETYEVYGHEGLPHWEYEDAYRTMIRIRTKQR